MGATKGRTLAQQALSILRRPDIDADVYLPGNSGVSISGLLTNNHTDSTGSTGYSANDGVAGLVLDGMGTVGANIATTAWILGAGWSNSPAGTLTASAVAAFFSASQAVAALTVGSTYKVRFTVSGFSSGSARFYAYGATQQNATYRSANGVYEEFFVASYANTGIGVQAGGSGFTGVISDISFQEVTGIHATQTTTANKPAVRRGAYNLFVQSGTFTTTWANAGVLSLASGFDDPDGGTSAYKMTEAATSGAHYVLQTATPNASYVTSVFVCKAAGRNRVKIRSESPQATLSVTFDLATGTVVSGTGTITHLGDDWYLCAAQSNASGTGASGYHLIQTLGAADAESYTGDGVSGVYLYRAGLFTGTLTAAQILAEGGIPLTTSAAASNPDAGRYWWSFDGSNDYLQLGSVPFQMSDDHCVIAGCRANTVAAGSRPLVSLYGTGTRRVAQLSIETATLTATWTDDAGTAGTSPTGTSVTAGISFVATARKVGNAKLLRKDGVDVNTSSTAAGTTTLTTAAIGTDGTGYLNGISGPVLIIKGTISDSDLLTLERWVASITPAAPTF